MHKITTAQRNELLKLRLKHVTTTAIAKRFKNRSIRSADEIIYNVTYAEHVRMHIQNLFLKYYDGDKLLEMYTYRDISRITIKRIHAMENNYIPIMKLLSHFDTISPYCYAVSMAWLCGYISSQYAESLLNNEDHSDSINYFIAVLANSDVNIDEKVVCESSVSVGWLLQELRKEYRTISNVTEQDEIYQITGYTFSNINTTMLNIAELL